ncbi:MAG: hypothetical protein JKY37_18785 [Nannocystaceae bacterium]|nr:hypothetical protein [Nannocystaceae bacterium]
MRIAAFILAILGGLAAAALGMTWLSDLAEYEGQAELIEQAGISVSSLRTAAYLLLAGLVFGTAGGVLALQRKGKIAAAVLVATAVAPAVFEPKALVFTFLLLIAGLLALGAKPKSIVHG